MADEERPAWMDDPPAWMGGSLSPAQDSEESKRDNVDDEPAWMGGSLSPAQDNEVAKCDNVAPTRVEEKPAWMDGATAETSQSQEKEVVRDVEAGQDVPDWMKDKSKKASTEQRPEARSMSGESAQCTCCCTMLSLARLVVVFVCLFILALVIGNWIPQARIPFPNSTSAFWKYKDANGISDVCILVQAIFSAFVICASEFSMLSQKSCTSCALFTFRFFGFMGSRHFQLLFVLLYSFLAATLSFFGVIAGSTLFLFSLIISWVAKNEENDANGLKDDPVRNLTLMNDEVKGKVKEQWNHVSLFNTGVDKEKSGLKSWVAPTFLLLTVVLNTLTLFLLLILTLPDEVITFDATKVYLIFEVAIFCLTNLLYSFSTCRMCKICTCTSCFCGVCSPEFIQSNLGFLLSDGARVATFVFQSFVCICTSSVYGFVMGGLLLANALAQILALCGLGFFYQDGKKPRDTMRLSMPTVETSTAYRAKTPTAASSASSDAAETDDSQPAWMTDGI